MVQAQVLRLLEDLQQRLGLAVVFITHDLSTLAAVCKRIAVMYAGRIVEEGPSHEVFEAPAHPYTRALAAAFPVIGDPAFRMAPSGLAGDPPDPRELPAGLPVPPALPGGGRGVRVGRRRAVAGRAGRRRGRPCVPRPRAAPGAEPPGGPVGLSLLEVRGLHVEFRGRAASRAPSTASTSRCARARSSRWSASRAAARRRWRARSSGSSARRRARCRCAASRCATTARSLRAHRREVQMIFQDPTGALNARQTIYEAVAEGVRIQKRARATRSSSWREALSRAGPAPARALLRPLPLRDLRRPAPARDHRRRDGARARACSSPTSRSRASTPRCAARSSR